jgi:GNAT superfamily N-acetyltransferase
MSGSALHIRPATPGPAEVESLASVLIDCVEGGASVGFMQPLARVAAVSFWERALASAARGERIVLVAETAAGVLVGTVQVVFAVPENQPHRADLAKMLVRRDARRGGVGGMLLRAAEAAARNAGRTLLVLDTVTGGDAERLYARLGWLRVGEIPNYALWPDGRLCSTTYFYKELR